MSAPEPQPHLYRALDRAKELEAENQRLRADLERALDALAFYANPDSYFAIAFLDDPPCGEFMDDFSDADDWSEFGAYGRPMPGARARAVLDDLTARNGGTT